LIHIIIPFDLDILGPLSINRENFFKSTSDLERGVVFGSSIYIFPECFLSIKEDCLDKLAGIVLGVKEWDLSIGIRRGGDDISIFSLYDSLTWEVGSVKPWEEEGSG